jgi:hypothetical protein
MEDPLIDELLDALLAQQRPAVMDDDPLDEYDTAHPWEHEIVDEFDAGQSYITDQVSFSRLVDLGGVMPSESTGLGDGSYALTQYMSRIPPSQQWDEWKQYLISAMRTLKVPVPTINDVAEQLEYLVQNGYISQHLSYLSIVLALLSIHPTIDQPRGHGIDRVYTGWAEYAVKFHIYKEDIGRYVLFVRRYIS